MPPKNPQDVLHRSTSKGPISYSTHECSDTIVDANDASFVVTVARSGYDAISCVKKKSGHKSEGASVSTHRPLAEALVGNGGASDTSAASSPLECYSSAQKVLPFAKDDESQHTKENDVAVQQRTVSELHHLVIMALLHSSARPAKERTP